MVPNPPGKMTVASLSFIKMSFLVKKYLKLMSLSELVNRMALRPAQIARYENQGEIKSGNRANFALVDLNSSWTVEPEQLKSKSKNTPCAGMELPAVIEKTFHNGALVFDRRG